MISPFEIIRNIIKKMPESTVTISTNKKNFDMRYAFMIIWLDENRIHYRYEYMSDKIIFYFKNCSDGVLFKLYWS